jgi:2-iminobutanoate/2-iminopropanoate deaminase
MYLRAFATFVYASVIVAFSADVSAQETRQYISPQSASTGGGAFSGAVLAGGTFYLSGTLGLEGGQPPATAQAEARNVLNNIQGTLEDAGMTMDDLVSVQVFSSNVADYAAFNEVYRTYFEREFPARAFVGAGPLLFDARFEVLGIAVKR